MTEAAARERYVGRCLALLLDLDGLVPARSLAEARHLVDHGEPSLGVEAVAWAVARQAEPVPAHLLAEVRSLVLDEADLPPDLDRYAG